jgi:hypothetical protein
MLMTRGGISQAGIKGKDLGIKHMLTKKGNIVIRCRNMREVEII